MKKSMKKIAMNSKVHAILFEKLKYELVACHSNVYDQMFAVLSNFISNVLYLQYLITHKWKYGSYFTRPLIK